MEKAIKKALEGGYSLSGYSKSNPKTYIADEKQYELFLDPLFWQCLGKQQGWAKREDRTFEAEMECWQARQHGLIDYINAGKSIDSFFEELLK